MKTVVEYNRKITAHFASIEKKKNNNSKIRVHEDGRLKKCLTTSKFNMNSVVKNTFFTQQQHNAV